MTVPQATLWVHLRDFVALVAASALLLTAFVASELATVSRVRSAQGVVVRHARGVVDTHRDTDFNWRRPVFRLARGLADPLLFTCPGGAGAVLRCPSTADWTPRDLGVDWIDLPTGLTGQFVHRATGMRAGDEVLFATTVDAVRAAEVACSVSAAKTACAIFGSMMLLFGAMALRLRHKLRAHAKLVEEANRRAAANKAAAIAAAAARRIRL